MEEVQRETQTAEQELSDFFDIRRYDTNFMGDILALFKPKPAPAQEKQFAKTAAAQKAGAK